MAGPYEDSQDDRTEAATTFRREEFRKKGIVAQSREVLSVVLFLFAGLVLYYSASHVFAEFSRYAEGIFRFDKIHTLTVQSVRELLFAFLKAWGWMVLPLFGVVMLAGFIGGVAQVGFFMTAEPITPNWDRINPVNGIQRIFSLSALTEAAKALLKMGVVFWVAWVFLKSRAHSVGQYFEVSIFELPARMGADVGQLFYLIAGALAVLAAADFFYQRYRIEQQMKMTKREVKEEFKMREGDPLIKSRIRNIQRRIARRRMLDAVPKADVVVTNPTHYAVALQYDPKKMRAPKVVAKGVDYLALRIREIAKQSDVPIVENKPLARTLYAKVPVGRVISEDLYTAVAQVLSYVYRAKNLAATGVQAPVS